MSLFHIVAIGARTSLGRSSAASAAAVRAGISRVTEHPFLVDTQGEPVRTAFDQALDPEQPVVERMCVLAEDALEQVTIPVGLGPVPVLLALPEPRPGFCDDDARRVERHLARLQSGERPRRVTSVGRGHAGVLQALELASTALTEDGAYLVGGVDSYCDLETLAWLSEHRQLMQSDARSSFFPGEGAWFALVMRESLRRQLRLSSLAVVRSCATATEAALIKTDTENLGHGLCEAVRSCYRGGDGVGGVIDEVFSDINGERYRAEEWGLTVLRTAPWFRDPSAYVAPAAQWGDLGAATGIALAGLAVESWRRGYASGSLAMVVAGSEGGLRGAAILERPSI